MRKAHRLSIGSLALVSAAATAAHAAPTTSVVRPPAPASSTSTSSAVPTVQDGGYELIELSTASGHTSFATAISASGTVGGYDRPDGALTPARAIVWSAPDASTFPWGDESVLVGFTPQGVPVGSRKGGEGVKGDQPLNQPTDGTPLGVGPNGKIVGVRFVGSGFSVGMQAWALNQKLDVVIQDSRYSQYSSAWGGNASLVVGSASWEGATPMAAQKPVKWTNDGKYVVLPGKGPNQNGIAYAVNAGGVIVGNAGAGTTERAARWDNDHLTELGSLGGKSNATAINAGGVIVGTSDDADGDPHAVVFRNGAPVNLNTLVHRPSLAPRRSTIERAAALVNDWFIQSATAINDKGEIVGWGVKQGKTRALLLRPTTKEISAATGDEVKAALRIAKPPRTRTIREVPALKKP